MELNFNKEFMEVVRKEAMQIHEEVIENRRYLHMNPEIGFDTHNTEALVKRNLESWGIEIIPGKMGVFGLIKGRDSSRMVALRADMDALCLQEENEVPYKSQISNKMHACGHDAHTAMLLGAAKILQAHKDELPMDVLLVFQPAEEGPNLGGARVMLADLQEKGMADKIQHFFGLHVFNDFPVGKLAFKYGPMMSSTDEFYIKIKGKGGHAGMPHQTIDALSLGAKVIGAMETFMSRRMDPFDSAVFSVGIFEAGSAINIIADSAKIAGTIRCQKEETRGYILENMERIVKGLCEAYGATCHIDVVHGLPPMVNDTETLDYAMAVAKEAFGEESCGMMPNPLLGAEDFAYFAKEVPSAFMAVGTGNPEKGCTYPVHHPKFDLDEDALVVGVQMLCNLAINIENLK